MLRVPVDARVLLRFLTLRRVEIFEFPNSPALLAGLWLAAIVLQVVEVVFFPGTGYTPPSSVLHLPGALILAALIAAWAVRRRTDAVRIGVAFMILGLVMSLLRLSFQALGGDERGALVEQVILWLWPVAAVARLLHQGWDVRSRQRGAILGSLSFGLLVAASATASSIDRPLMAFMYQSSNDDQDAEQYAEIDHETVWPLQPALVAAAAEWLQAKGALRPRTLILALAAGGSQQLFGREARGVLDLLKSYFGNRARGALMSNARADLTKVPLATTTNLAELLKQVGQTFDPQRDTMVIYLTAHGSRQAELGTDLPGFSDLKPISAAGLARSLNAAGIKRRIVIVSACYSGSWIEPLASPDTIVLTAAAADRTSFGCDDSRQFTVFGESLINSALGRGASLRDGFEDIKRRVSAHETKVNATPSLPQAFVGARMQALWTQAPSPR